jgi:hypothetical protein
MSHTFIACALAAGLTFAVACSQGPSPTAPSLAAAVASSQSSIIYDVSETDSLLNGNEAQLVGFDVASGLLTFNTTSGAVAATLHNGTVFRDAQLSRYAPVDPCRQFAIDYNTAGTTVDTNGVYLAISAMAGNGCIARIHLDKTVPPNPIAPIRSLRPLPTF